MRQAFPRRHWLDRRETSAKHPRNRQPAPPKPLRLWLLQAHSTPLPCQHVVALDLVTSLDPFLRSPILPTHGAGVIIIIIPCPLAIIGRPCSTGCCQRLPTSCRAAHLRRGRQRQRRQRDSTSPAGSSRPKPSTLGLLHLHTFLDSAHHITTPSSPCAGNYLWAICNLIVSSLGRIVQRLASARQPHSEFASRPALIDSDTYPTPHHCITIRLGLSPLVRTCAFALRSPAEFFWWLGRPPSSFENAYLCPDYCTETHYRARLENAQ